MMTKQTTGTEISEEVEHGPAMRALTDKQRKFVQAALASPESNPTDWARLAGYKDKGGGASNIRVCAHGLMHDPRIEAAIVEIARSSFTTGGVALAASNLLRIARDQKHPRNYDATIAIMNRVGMHEKSEHVVKVSRPDDQQMLEMVARLANELGVDPSTLIGANTTAGEVHRQKLIDVTPTQAKVPVVESDPFEEVASIRLAEPK
jgi:hypothetical protein